MAQPAHLELAISQIDKLHDGPDVERISDELGVMFPANQPYWEEANASTAWCGIFVAWCLGKTGHQVGGLNKAKGYGPMYVDWWLDYGTAVPASEAKPGDIAIFLGSPHHVTFYAGNGEYVGGNQSDAVTRAHYRTPNAVRRPPPINGDIITTREDVARETRITATVFGGARDPNVSAYDEHRITDDEVGCSLPFRFKGKRPRVRVINPANGRSVVCAVVDVGPWNINDPYWQRPGGRPQAEQGFDLTGRKTNSAGIDLTPAAARAIGIDGKGVVDWEFTTKENNVDDTKTPTPLPVPAPAGAESHFLSNAFVYFMQNPDAFARIQAFIAFARTGQPSAPVAPAPADGSPQKSSKPDLVVGIFGLIAAALGAHSGTTAPPIGEASSLMGVLQFIVPAALSIFGLGKVPIIGPLLALITKR